MNDEQIEALQAYEARFWQTKKQLYCVTGYVTAPVVRANSEEEAFALVDNDRLGSWEIDPAEDFPDEPHWHKAQKWHDVTELINGCESVRIRSRSNSLPVIGAH
jgi:hypothetical protein